MLKFCEKCDSKLIRTKFGHKCPKCEGSELKQINESPKETPIEKFVKGDDFPFVKGQYYKAKKVRETFGFGVVPGINYSKEGYFLVLFMNARDPKDNENNPYHDYYNEERDEYHYTGKGKKGNQTLEGVNNILAKSNETNTEIHFFRQYHLNSNHQYIGKVRLVDICTTIQTDKDSDNRQVYEFTLKPIP